jgi:NaMN:DMB phosphoribosyltransferase
MRLHEQGRAMSAPSLERGVKLLARMASYEAWRQENA